MLKGLLISLTAAGTAISCPVYKLKLSRPPQLARARVIVPILMAERQFLLLGRNTTLCRINAAAQLPGQHALRTGIAAGKRNIMAHGAVPACLLHYGSYGFFPTLYSLA